MRAFNPFGVSEWCNEKSAITPAYTGSGTPYLADLTLDRPGIKEGQTATATVTLSAPAPTGGATITLANNNGAAVQMPGNVSIPAGMLSATFSVTGKAGGASAEGAFVAIRGEYSNWIQAAILTVVPPSLSLTAQNLKAWGGNGVVILSWKELPQNAVRGYRVYRRTASSTQYSELTSSTTPCKSAIYADLNASGGTTYEYAIVAERWSSDDVAPTGSGTTVSTSGTANPPVARDIGD